jgi:antitoxin (DNA-binding transcriptional repressor) of toxin-antitoxin stability system
LTRFAVDHIHMVKYFGAVKEILISEFKAHCIAEIKEVHRSGRALTITLRGKPIAQVVPFLSKGEPAVKLGSRPGDATIKRDLVQADFGDEWEVNG